MRSSNSQHTVFIKVLLLTAILLGTGCVNQSTTETSMPASIATTNNQPPPSNLVCRHEKETGSHRKVKVCKTSAQIAVEKNAAKKTIRRITGGSNSSSVGS